VIPYNSKLKELSKNLRHEQTDAEKCLWERIRHNHLGYTFYRQKPIGEYIVDFYCPKRRLVIEVDGGQHFSGETKHTDEIRDEYMRSLGLTIMRFSNSDVLKNTDSVAEAIYERMGKIFLTPPLQKGDKPTD
jgi:very-short-patch-repair endonuclease